MYTKINGCIQKLHVRNLSWQKILSTNCTFCTKFFFTYRVESGYNELINARGVRYMQVVRYIVSDIL